MSQYVERVLDDTEAVIFTVTADTGMRGTDISVTGIWYSPAQITQLQEAIGRANDWLREQGE